MTVQTFPAVYLPLENLSVDKFDNTFTVLDDTKNPYNYYSGFTSGKLTVYNPADSSTVFEFSTTGATNTITTSGSASGLVRFYSPSLAVNAGEYVYKFYVKNSTEQKTIMYGTFIVI